MEARATKAVRVSARFEILSEPPVAPEPGEKALDHPAARQDDKVVSSLRLTMSRRSGGTFATAASTCASRSPRLYRIATLRGLDGAGPSSVRHRDQPAPRDDTSERCRLRRDSVRNATSDWFGQKCPDEALALALAIERYEEERQAGRPAPLRPLLPP